MFLYRWMIETGDPIEVIAKGFDLDAVRVVEILDGQITRLRADDMANLKRKLSLDSSELACAGPISRGRSGRRDGRDRSGRP